jgi:hypothetical protein
MGATVIVALSRVLRFLEVWFSPVSTMMVFLGDVLPRAFAVVLFKAVVALLSLPYATLGGAIIRLAFKLAFVLEFELAFVLEFELAFVLEFELAFVLEFELAFNAVLFAVKFAVVLLS